MSSNADDRRRLSDAYSHQVLEALRRFEPEMMTAHGMAGAEEDALVFPREDLRNEVFRKLETRRTMAQARSQEPDPEVRFDLGILQDSVRLYRRKLTTEKITAEKALPRVRKDHRLSPEIYALRLAQHDVSMSVDELIDRARAVYAETLRELYALADTENRREVLGELHGLYEEQIFPAVVREVYSEWKARLRRLVLTSEFASLPEREVIVSVSPTKKPHPPYLCPPKLLGSLEGPLIFLLPGSMLVNPEVRRDYLAPSAIPAMVLDQIVGHGLHLGAVLDARLTTARIFLDTGEAFFSGWPVYVEKELSRSLSAEVQMIVLHRRLLTAARALLEVKLHAGRIGLETAERFLMRQVGLDKERAREVLEDLLFRSPGRAPAKLVGYLALSELRAEVEEREGAAFNLRAFHDRVIGAGILSMKRLRSLFSTEER